MNQSTKTDSKCGRNAQPPIVIVEDDRALARVVQMVLQEAGYNSKWFSSGSEAIEWLCKHSCTLMLLDYRLPDLTGAEIVKVLRQKDCPTPFIMLTSEINIKLAIDLMKQGALDYLLKESGVLELLPGVVERVLEQIKTEARLAHAEQALRESEERLKLAVQGSSDGLWDWPDVNKDKEWWSSRFYELLGYKDGEFQASLSKFKEILHPDDLERTIAAMEAHFEDRVPFDIEYRFKTKSGEYRWFRGRGQAVWDEEGHPVRMSGSVQDIHVRMETERILQESYKQTEQLLTSISSILIGVGPDDKIRRWNAAATNAFGFESNDVIGKKFSECGIDWNWSEVLEHISSCRDRCEPTKIDDVRYIRPDGKERFLGITINPISNLGTEDAGYLLLAADITESKFLESQLSHAQKLESIGQLAAGIAHEINTPMQFVGDNIRFLQDAFSDLSKLLNLQNDFIAKAKEGGKTEVQFAEIEKAAQEMDLEYLIDDIPKAIHQSLEGVDRVANIVRAMKEFSHPGEEEKTAIDVNNAIRSTVTVSRNEWKYVAEMVTDLDPSLPCVLCLRGDFNQVILNIIINAAHAIADVVGDGSETKGVITISTRKLGDSIEIRIGDTGTGISPEIQSKVFDPFFTTKEVGRGTGQGLAISYNVIVEKHQGELTLESEVGKGTTFIIRLPSGDCKK